MPTGLNIEVATFRSDGAYIDGRRPQDVTFTGTAKDDVERRDFTINALLINIVNGQVLDFVGGCADIDKGIIAAVGDPAARLTEDRLRVLRALRFAARLGFHMTESTWMAVCRTTLDGVSRERLMQEWKKAMAGPGRGMWFELVQRSGHLSSVCAPVATYAESARQSLRVRLDQITATDQESLILALWLLDADQASAVAWMDSMPLSSAWKRSTTWLLMHGRSPERLRGLSIAERRRCWRHADGRLLARLLALQDPAAVADLVAECAQEPSEPLIPLLRAEDLMRLGILPGPDLGALLRRIEDGQLAGSLSDVTDATKMVLDWLGKKTKET
jgi:poly(A) polymerase